MRLPVPIFSGRDLDPFEGFRRDFDDLLNDFRRRSPKSWGRTAAFDGLAGLDFAETKDAVEISTELPGVDEGDVKVSIDGQSVVISGEEKSEAEKTDKARRVVERSYGAFRRVALLTSSRTQRRSKRLSTRGCFA
ncbi:MAG: Hsp20/alpha crystallin family protein [Roseiarcus sp.]|jgi:HSP20 family protein